MATSRELEDLISQIRATRSPVKRMRLVARGWSLLRHLSPLDRRRLVAKLGIERFEEVADKLGYGDAAIEPEELDLILDKVGEVEPHKIRDLISNLKDPERRKEMARKGLEAIQKQLRQPQPPPAEGAGKPQPVPAPPPAPAPKAVGAPAPVSARPAPAPRAPAPQVKPRAPKPAPPSAPPASGPRPVTRAPAPVPPAAPRTRPRAVPPPRAAVRRAPPDRSEAMVGEIAAAGTLMSRFRKLRQALARGARPDAAKIRAVLDLFPEGWARRRALTAILGAGAPADFDAAVALVAEMDRDADRRWCAMALVSSRELDGDEIEKLLDQVPSASLRRRLGRAGGRR